MFKDFTRWLLRAFGLFVVVVFLFFAAHAGWLGSDAANILHSVRDRLADFYQGEKDAIDTAVWLIGAGASFTTAVLAIHRAWYYAEINLPTRVEEYLLRAVGSHLNMRPALLATVNDPVAPSNFLTPLVHYRPFYRAMRKTGLGGPKAIARDLVASLSDLRTHIGSASKRKRELEARAITAYLLRAAQAVAQASSLKEHSDAWRTKNQESLNEILQALKVNSDDPDALEFAARQALLLDDEDNALRYLGHMSEMAKDDPVKQARALRLQAEVYGQSGSPADLDEARLLLVGAIDQILLPTQQTSPERTLELARAYRLRGEVQLRRERYTAAEVALKEAMARFERLRRGSKNGKRGKLGAFSSIADQGCKSTEDALKRLEQARLDKEAPGD